MSPKYRFLPFSFSSTDFCQTLDNSAEETLQLLSYSPDRLGHATFLNDEAKSLVRENKSCIEICLSSNLLFVCLPSLEFTFIFDAPSCKTVTKLEDHHIRYYLQHDHPIAVCVRPVPHI